MTRAQFERACLAFADARLDAPFEGDFVTQVARHRDSRRWYALIFERNGRTYVNLKCDPLTADFWRQAYRGVTPAWHMNKQHWNSVELDSDVPEDIMLDMLDESHRLTL